MSKLPNAPLLEVIFDIKWDVSDKNEIAEFQFLHGDLYSKIKKKYPHRENLVPAGLPIEIIRNAPIFRYRPKQGDYPLIQIGPGLLSINANDDKYYWESFSSEINNVHGILTEISDKYGLKSLTPSLTYIDFFEFDKINLSSLDFINSKLQLSVSEKFITAEESAFKDLNITLNYKIGDNSLSVNIYDGHVGENKSGIILQIKVIGSKKIYSKQDLGSWIDSAHELSSSTFKSLSQGDLYNSFK